ncbi:hypothetical protein TSUD_40270 [Trifolium subterraneum]|uniref:Uncharacterized protein n=1 Tax=Trifolium subterraneum TaxID=3900 RepID=A0A2Z6MWW3_TRISU|nr:hypothetical protein TSUD_40270 [Trifolium subterraneum]
MFLCHSAANRIQSSSPRDYCALYMRNSIPSPPGKLTWSSFSSMQFAQSSIKAHQYSSNVLALNASLTDQDLTNLECPYLVATQCRDNMDNQPTLRLCLVKIAYS